MQIVKRGTSLLIRFTHEHKRYSFSLPNSNNEAGMATAKLKAAQIEDDISKERFDPTLMRYRPRHSGKNATDITAVELVRKYIDYRFSSLSNGSIVRLQAIASKLDKLLGDKRAEKVTESVARSAIDEWLKTASAKSDNLLAVGI
jgi:integrase